MNEAASGGADTGSPTTFSPLRNSTFRSIWLASQVSSLGWMMHTVAVGWLMATISTSDTMVALVQASTTLPAFILSVFVGAVADNFSRRVVMLTGRSLIVTGSAILTSLIATGFVDPWTILGVSFIIGCGVALTDPAWQASVGDLVERHDLPAAVTLINIGFNTIRSIGPALGGIVVASFGPLVALALSTLSYAVPVIVIWRAKWTVRYLPLPRESIATAIYDGARFTAMSQGIKAAVIRGGLLGLAGVAILALLPLVVRDQLNGGASTYGILMGGFGFGALCGGVTTNHLRRLLSQEWLIRLACLACAACSLTLAFAPSVLLATAALVLGGTGWVIAWSGLGVSVQLASPRWVVGRTVSIYYALTYGGFAAGSWIWGTLAENHSLTLALGGAAGALILVGATGLLLPVAEDQGTDHSPVEGFKIPAVSLDLKPRSGPIVVKTDYRIPEENTETFLTLMQKRRRAQSRIGARHWTLERDLQEPCRWTETFRTPTWTDFLRLNHRLDEADRKLDQSLNELVKGGHRPATRLSIERLERSSKAEHVTPFVARI